MKYEFIPKNPITLEDKKQFYKDFVKESLKQKNRDNVLIEFPYYEEVNQRPYYYTCSEIYYNIMDRFVDYDSIVNADTDVKQEDWYLSIEYSDDIKDFYINYVMIDFGQPNVQFELEYLPSGEIWQCFIQHKSQRHNIYKDGKPIKYYDILIQD